MEPWWWNVPYDPAPYTDDEGHVWCKVTVTFQDGETRSATGDFLDAEPLPELGCGIEELAKELGLLHMLDCTPRYIEVCYEATRQLARQPWAALTCPELSVRLDLVEVPR